MANILSYPDFSKFFKYNHLNYNTITAIIRDFTCKKLSVKNPPSRLPLQRGSNDSGMATFGLRYFAQLRSKYKGVFWRVEIAESDYSGPLPGRSSRAAAPCTSAGRCPCTTTPGLRPYAVLHRGEPLQL